MSRLIRRQSTRHNKQEQTENLILNVFNDQILLIKNFNSCNVISFYDRRHIEGPW